MSLEPPDITIPPDEVGFRGLSALDLASGYGTDGTVGSKGPRSDPLNEQERLKLARHPFEVAAAVLDRYAFEGPEALLEVPGEVERLKWVGIYPQRQGGDAFMMRIKVPGGVLGTAQAIEIGRVAQQFATGPVDHPLFGNNYADLTTRQTIQLHWLHMSDIPEIWRRFASVGLTSVQACGDCARNVTSCPVSGVDPHELVDSLTAARAVSSFFTGNAAYANLPRKFKISIAGCTENCARAEINDIGLWPARLGDTTGFSVLVGGGLSDGERLASDLDVFVEPHQAVELCRAVAHLYGELGNRTNRGVARMRYLVQELGVERFRAELLERLAFTPRSGAVAATTGYRRDHVGVHPQPQRGLSYVGVVVPVGRMTGTQLAEAARIAASYGDGSLRLGVDQNLHFSGVPDDRLDDLLSEDLLATFSPNAGPFTRGVVACTGSEFCRYAVTETKQQALELARRLDARLDELSADSPLRSVPLRIHVSGCSASCAQPQIADVGLRGAVHKGDHALLEGYDVGLGGALGPEAGFGNWVEGAVPVEELDDAILRTATAYDRERRGDETFTSWVRRVNLLELRDIVGGR
jgi:ferredoxin-nitrite reductase